MNGPISANGAAGVSTSGTAGAGGGGSGGSIYLNVGTLAGNSTIKALAGNGGNNSAGGADGGGGGGGRIAIYYITDTSTFLAGMSAANDTTKGKVANNTIPITGGALDGADGSLYTLQYTVPSTPTITAPTNGATNQSRTPTMTSSAYSANGQSHTTSDWQMSDDNTFSNSDCSDTNIVYCSLDSSNKTSLVVNASNGTFQNALSGKTQLAPNTTYYVRIRHTNAAGDSSWSSSISFTTQANTTPATPTNVLPNNSATNVSKNPTLSGTAFSDADLDSHLSSDWLVYESSDCSDTAAWSTTGHTSNLASIIVNSSNGTFAGTLAGQTGLKAHTTYSWKFRYTDAYSATSSYSACTSFTTTNTAPTLGSNIPTQTLTEDTNATNAFDLDTYFSDVDFNDDDNYTCTVTNDLDGPLGHMTLNANRSVDFTLNANAPGSDTIQFSCQDGGGLATASNAITVTVTNVNDNPTISALADQTVSEDAATSSLAFTVSDIETSASNLTVTASSANVALVPNANLVIAGSGGDKTITITPAAHQTGSSVITVTVNDGTTTVTEAFTVTVSAVNDAPTFTGSLSNVSFIAGTTTATVFDLDDYFSDVDNSTLNYAATGQTQVTVTISAGAVTLSAPVEFFGTEEITFTAQDSVAASASSNAIVVTVSEPPAEPPTDDDDSEDTSELIAPEDISYVGGTSKGNGIVTIYDLNNEVIAEFQAFPVGGVIPRLMTIGDEAYILTVKQSTGTTIRIYQTNGEIVLKRRLSPRLHWRKLTIGNLKAGDDTEEIVVTTKRADKLHFRIFSFDPAAAEQLDIQKRVIYTGISSNDYAVTIANQAIHLISKGGQTILDWKPFE